MTGALFGPVGAFTFAPEVIALMAFAAALALFAPNSLEVAGYAENLGSAFPKPGGRAVKFIQPTPMAATATAIMLVAGLAVAWKPAVFIYFNF